VIAALLIGTVGMFYFLQQFLVYDQNGVTLQLPFMETEAPEIEEEAVEEAVPTFEPVEVTLVFEDPDFTGVDLGGWEDLEPARLRFVPFSSASDANLLNAAISGTAGDFTGIVLELKGRNGYLAWSSRSAMAAGYGTAGSLDYTETVAAIHEKGLTAAAQISCCADMLLATRNWPIALQTADGSSYQDGDGVYWLDPYNRQVRAYLIELMEELALMGFDEIILADLYHPVTDSALTYSVTIQTEPDPVVAVCQLARRLVESVEDRDVTVSALIDRSSAMNGSGAQTGQDLDIFWRLFARLYCPTDYWSVANDLQYVCDHMTEGDVGVRFVPVLDMVPEDCRSYEIKSAS